MFFTSAAKKAIYKEIGSNKTMLNDRIDRLRDENRSLKDKTYQLEFNLRNLQNQVDEMRDLLGPTLEAVKQERDARIEQVNKDITERLTKSIVENSSVFKPATLTKHKMHIPEPSSAKRSSDDSGYTASDLGSTWYTDSSSSSSDSSSCE
jgi:predicted nuclease with TOPRIM domain